MGAAFKMKVGGISSKDSPVEPLISGLKTNDLAAEH